MAEQQIREILNGMTKEQLLNFIAQKGNERKQALYDVAKFQTSDCHHTTAVQRSVDVEVDRMHKEQANFEQELNAVEQESHTETQHIESLKNKISSKEQELESERRTGANSATFVANCRTIEVQVTKDLIKKVNFTLENDSPDTLTKALEHFVSLLRNKPNTKPVDVELFFKDQAKLVSKMRKTDTTSCNLDLVLAAKADLDGLRASFGRSARVEGQADISIFSCFVEWSINFCDAAKIDLRLFALESEIKELKAELERATLRVSRFERIFQDTREFEFGNYYVKTIKNLETRQRMMETIVDTDQQQAMEYQQKLNHFEKKYFESYLKIAQTHQ